MERKDEECRSRGFTEASRARTEPRCFSCLAPKRYIHVKPAESTDGFTVGETGFLHHVHRLCTGCTGYASGDIKINSLSTDRPLRRFVP